MRKVMRIGTSKTHNGRAYSVYVRVEWDGKRLSISGVEGPLSSGDCIGACGQIDMSDWNIVNYAPGWSKALELELRAIWKRWHLNDMHAECKHQRARGETYETHPSAICPDCGYSLGSAWLHEDVPADVIARLKAFPDADKPGAWPDFRQSAA